MKVIYARTSSAERTVDLQLARLERALLLELVLFRSRQRSAFDPVLFSSSPDRIPDGWGS